MLSAYAISSTDTAHDATGLRAYYAMSGTEVAYDGMGLRAFYAMSGTDIAYGGYLPFRVLCDDRY
eukprot:3180156-Rhodomonas_salina.1